MKVRGKRHNLTLLVLACALALSLACGTLEMGVERTPPSVGQTAATETPPATPAPGAVTEVVTPHADASSTPAPAPTPLPPPTELRVVFVKVTEHGNNAWLWTQAEREAMPLTKAGGVGGVKLSGDGEIVAFSRGDGLWMVRSDGADERELVSADDFAAMLAREAFDSEVVLNRFEWLPGTHILAFNTRIRTEIGLVLNDDLHLVNADTLERTALLPPGEGGEFYGSPDGHQIAVVTAGSISLVSADGSDFREVLTYTPVATYSEFQFYAEPTWARDSSSLRVAIPPADPLEQPPQLTSIWRIRADGTRASMLSSIETGQMKPSAFSPDFRYVAHLPLEQADTVPSQTTLLVTNLETGDTIAQYPEVSLIYEWSPDSLHIAFLAYPEPEGTPQAMIGQLGGGAVPACRDADTVIDLRWVDAERYLCLAQSSRGWNILLGQVGGPVLALAGVVGAPPAYDFAAPAAGESPTTDTETPAAPESDTASSLFGLLYETADGLWHVNADGESLWILDQKGAAMSPAGTQFLHEDTEDIWLVDVATGERRNVTRTPDRSECCAQWWPGQPDVILFSSKTPENEGPNYGYPTVARLDGTAYRILDDSQVSYALPAPSPEGQTVAYDRSGRPWVYHPLTGPEPFDLASFGLSNTSQWRVVSPAWSPDGERLAWVIGDCGSGECQYSIGVFDLETETAQLSHAYVPIGRGGQPPAPIWSPDGQWLAYIAWAQNQDEAGLWVFRTAGQQTEEHMLATGRSRVGADLVWSPDGRWLAFSSTPEGVGSGLWLAEAGTWDLQALDLPADAILVDWIQPAGSP